MSIRALLIVTVFLLAESSISVDEENETDDCRMTMMQDKLTLSLSGDPADVAEAPEGGSAVPLVAALELHSSQRVLDAEARNPPFESLVRGFHSEVALSEVSAVIRHVASTVRFGPAIAEFIAMTLFVIVGCGSAMGVAQEKGSAWILQVSLTFGLAITTLAYAIGHYSGGQINCAVTLGLVIAGQCGATQGILNFFAQLLGSLAGATILAFMYPPEKDRTGSMAANSLSEGVTWKAALLGEFVMTFLLVFVVLETATNPAAAANRPLAAVAIGFAVFLAHSVLIPIDGCSINPTRSFGPEVVSMVRYGKVSSGHFVFWLGPLAGAAAASGIHLAVRAA